MEFFQTLLKDLLPVKQCHKELSLECFGVLYTPMNVVNILQHSQGKRTETFLATVIKVKKSSLSNEFFYGFQ